LLCEALKRGLHGFVWVLYGFLGENADPALWRYCCFAERSREASLCIYCFTECSRETLVVGLFWVFWVALSIERRVCGFLSECLDVNGMFYQAH
jgi:hypothetical protein